MSSMINNRTRENMKKMRFFILAMVMTFGLAAFTTSCNELEEWANTCTCTYKEYEDSQTYKETVKLDELSAEAGFDITSCQEVEDMLSEIWYYITCY